MRRQAVGVFRVQMSVIVAIVLVLLSSTSGESSFLLRSALCLKWNTAFSFSLSVRPRYIRHSHFSGWCQHSRLIGTSVSSIANNGRRFDDEQSTLVDADHAVPCHGTKRVCQSQVIRNLPCLFPDTILVWPKYHAEEEATKTE